MIKPLCLQKIQLMVLRAGLEPAHLSARDFKSLVSTYFTIGAKWNFKFLRSLLATNSIVCCYVIIIAPFAQVVNTYFKIFLVLKPRIELGFLTYQVSVLPLYYKSILVVARFASHENAKGHDSDYRNLVPLPRIEQGSKV